MLDYLMSLMENSADVGTTLSQSPQIAIATVLCAILLSFFS